MTKSASNQSASNILDIFDFTDPIKNVYLYVLKAGIATVDECTLKADPQADRTEIKIYLDILVRQEYLEKYKDGDIVKYKVKGLKRKAREVPNDIWEMLEK